MAVSIEAPNIVSIVISSLAILTNIIFFIVVCSIPNKPTKANFRFLSIQFIFCSLLICVYSIISSATGLTMCNLVLFFRNLSMCPITSTCLCIVLVTYSTLQSKQKIESSSWKFRGVFLLLSWVIPIVVIIVNYAVNRDMAGMEEGAKFCLTTNMVHKVVMGCLIGAYELVTIVISIVILFKLCELSKYFVEKDLTRKVMWKIISYIIGILVFLTIVMIETPLPYFRKVLPENTYIVGRILLSIVNPVLLGLFVCDRQVQKKLTRLLLCKGISNVEDSTITKGSELESSNSEGMKVELDIEFEKQYNNNESSDE